MRRRYAPGFVSRSMPTSARHFCCPSSKWNARSCPSTLPVIRSSPFAPLTSTRATSPGSASPARTTPEGDAVPASGQRRAPHSTREAMPAAAAQKRREVTSNLTISLPAARGLPRRSAMKARARRRAHCLQREAAMDNPKTSRREFCAHAISLVTVASLIEGCGGKGNPAGPGGGGSNVPQLATINGSAAGGTVTVSNVSGTALANVGGAALVQAGGNKILVIQTAQGSFSAFTLSALTNRTSLPASSPTHLRVSGSRVAVQHQRCRRAGTGDASASRFTTQFTNNVLTITV